MPTPTAIADWRAANALAIDCRELVYQGSRVQCPECSRWVACLNALERIGLRCATCSKRALGRFVL